ncbi:MAG: class I SAM-dependent methyltransferase [Rubrivivax sp.]|nr:MAG: class I SAM-dependent methyltransferase [Rubrivivax sp.]
MQSLPSSPLMAASDKSFWHAYVDFYAQHFPADVHGLVVEFGVLNGNSIRWLSERFPSAQLIGADILPVQPSWPQSERIRYAQVDQDSETQVATFLAGIEPPRLLIEDGSHIPRHQSRCLRLGFEKLASGGLYVLEDIHTSHPAHSLFQGEFGHVDRAQTSLHVLLAFDHAKRLGLAELNDSRLDRLAGPHFTRDQLQALYAKVDSISVYKRSTLPTQCWRCGSTEFDYLSWCCTCGEPLMASADSMTIVLRKK